MAKKFIRKNADGMVIEVIPIEDIKKFNKQFHRDFIKSGEVIDKACRVGQVEDGSGKYVKFTESASKKAERAKGVARGKIKNLRSEAIDKLIENSTDPDVMAIVIKMDTEKGKL